MSGQAAKMSVDAFLGGSSLGSENISASFKAPDYDDIIKRASQTHNVDPGLIRAMIGVESLGRPSAVSNKGAGGLMQLMPATAEEMDVTDRFDPEQNIMGGTRYIRQQLDRFDDNETLALAAYNAGAKNVTKYGGVPPFPETQDYIKKIAAQRKEETPSVSAKMPVDAFLDSPVKEGSSEKTAGSAHLQNQPSPTMFERGKEAVADFFRPSFAPESASPVGMEDMPESAIPAGMPQDIPGRRDEINARLGQIRTGASTDNIDALQTQLEEISSQAVDSVLPPNLYEQYAVLRPQYEQAVKDYNARATETQGLRGELEDLKQQEYGAGMTRPVSTVTGEPVPLPKRPEQIFSEEEKQVLPALKRGAVHGLTGLAGTVGTGLEYVGTKTGAEPLREVGKTTREYWEEKGKAFGPTPYIQGAILEKPELMTKGAWWAYNLADMAPSFAAMAIPGIAAGKHIQLAGQVLKLTPKVIERLSKIGALTTAGVAGGGMEGAGTYQEILDRGGSEEDAAAGMEAMTLAAGALNTVGFGKITGSLEMQKTNALMRFLEAGSWEGLTEYLEEPAEVLIKRGILPDVAFSKDDAIEQLKYGFNVIPVAGVMGGAASTVISEPAAPNLSETQKNLVKEVIQEEIAKQPSLLPAIPEKQIPLVPPGMPPLVEPPATVPTQKALPSGQGFELVKPVPEVRLRPSPEKIEGPEYLEGADFVAGKSAPENLEVEYKPVLSTRGLPWKEKENALRALKSRKNVSPSTHKVVKVKNGYGIVPFASSKTGVATKAKPEEVKGKTLIAFVRAMGGIRDKTLPGEIRALSGKETGVVGLTTSRPDKGLGFDEMAEVAVEHGWLPENLDDSSGAFSELLRDDIFAQKEKKPRVERLADIEKRTEREERWKEFEQAEDEELEYFAKHPDEVTDADLDEWQRETISEIRKRNEADITRKIEESVKGEVEAENPKMGELRGNEGFSEYIEGWDEKDLLDEESLAKLEVWRTGEEKSEVPEFEKPDVASARAVSLKEKLAQAHSLGNQIATMVDEDKIIEEDLGEIFDTVYAHADGLRADRIEKIISGETSIKAQKDFDIIAEEKILDKEIASMQAVVGGYSAVLEKPAVSAPEKEKSKEPEVQKKEAFLRESEAPYVSESGMYSALTKAAESKKIPEKMSAASVINRLRKFPGVKQAEIDTVGLSGWLEGKERVSKAELVDFLKTQGQAIMEPAGKYKQSELDIAFGGKKKADEAIESVAKDVEAVSSRRVSDIRGVPAAKTGIAEDLRKKKRVDLSGEKLTKGNEAQEIAELFQIYRSPKMEILHAIYTAEDGAILAHNAITSGDLTSIRPGNLAKYTYRLRATAKRLKAARIHLLHNHPSGYPAMSKEDVAMARALHASPTRRGIQLGDLLGEFVVIDHGEFTWVSEYRKDGATDVTNGSYKVTPGTGAWMEKKGPALTSPQAVAAFGQSLAYDKTNACFIYVNSSNEVVGWSTHDNKILKKDVPELEKILKQQAKGHNANKTIIIADDMSLLEPIAEHGYLGIWLLDALDVEGNSLRELAPYAFEGKRSPAKPARGLLEPETPYGKQEVISKDGTTVDWKKTMTLLKQKVYGTYKKDGSFDKWRTRAEISKIKALKKATAKYKEQLGKAKEKFKAKAEKIKTAKDIVKRRREKIRNIKEFFMLSDSDLRTISRKDIRLMSDFEFKKFKDDLQIKAKQLAERKQALNELELLRKEKAFIAEKNIRTFHKFPTIHEMTTEQLSEYAEILSKYEKGDQFLTPKRVKGLELTPWKGSNTIREVLEKASEEFDVPMTELQGIRVQEFDRFRYDTSLARQNPFYNFMVDTINLAQIKNQFRYFEEREKLYKLAKAALESRKRGLAGKFIPRQKELMKYLEAEEEAKIETAEDLTTEEMALADAIEDFYRRAYNWLLVSQELKSSRFADSKYVFHSKRPISEMLADLKDTGIKSAAKDLLNRWRLDEAQFKILDSKTGDILRMKKFFRQTLYRTGELTPTKNVVKATDIYMQQFFKKMALDESVPAIETLVMALRPKEKTPTGIFLNDSLMTFVKEYLNSKKGRTLNIGIQQGGKIDTVIRFVNQMISLRYIALNIPLQAAAIIGETTAKLPALGNRKLILANIRRHTPRGRRILKKYKAFTGEGVFEEVLQPARNIGENINMVLYGLFKWSRKVTKQDILLGNMTKAEFKAETIDPKKLAEAVKATGRWVDIEGTKSVLGTTSSGAAVTKFKGWAIPIASSTAQNAASLARTLTRLGNPKKRLTRQQFQELYRIAETGAILTAVLSLGIDDEDDDTFVGKMKHYGIRELGTLYSALSPRTMLTFGVTIAFLEKLSQNLHLLMTLEKYKTRDEFKGVTALKKQLTPAAITQFREKEQDQKSGQMQKPLSGGLSGKSLSGALK